MVGMIIETAGPRPTEAVRAQAEVMPPGTEVRALGPREYAYLAPRMSHNLRVTTDPTYFEAHADSVELWSPGAPVFPDPASVLARGVITAPVAESPASGRPNQ